MVLLILIFDSVEIFMIRCMSISQYVSLVIFISVAFCLLASNCVCMCDALSLHMNLSITAIAHYIDMHNICVSLACFFLYTVLLCFAYYIIYAS